MRRVQSAGAFDDWCRLRQTGGRRVTLVDLYRLAGRERGLEPHELPLEERNELASRAMPLILPGFELAEGSGRGDPLELAAPDPDWPSTFAAWKERLAGALGPVAERIDHVGSTAVPGLAAKPTIDIQISVQGLEDEDRYAGPLERSGLQLRSRDSLHVYFRPPATRPRDVHVHVCESGGRWEREHLLFRDYLRAHPQAAARYAAVKEELLVVWSDDRWGYTEAKSDCILGILDEAETWAQAAAWKV
jgi:GrpB-like predicted nucleotidyltransferase (UPF0157 family)